MRNTRELATAAAAAIALLVAASTADADSVRSGTFSGASGHATSGTVTIRADGDGYVVTLESDFRFDGAPDPRFAFGDARSADAATIFGKLGKNSGEQTYRVPASVDPGRFAVFYLWCKRFDVPLGKATLTAR